jgi:dephospho-CoA kinase
MRQLGLTGGIGSGKSTVAALFARLGATIIDADANSRSVTAPGGRAIDAIRTRFGPTFIREDGSLDRERMRQLAFADAQAKQRLEAIIHPLVGQLAIEQTEAARAKGCPLVIHDIPLLVESGRWRARLDQILVVDCSEETQVRRVMQRSAMTEAAVRAVIAAQATRSARLAAADAVLYNDGLSLAALEAQVMALAPRFGL